MLMSVVSSHFHQFILESLNETVKYYVMFMTNGKDIMNVK